MIVNKFEQDGLLGKIFKTEIGYYFRIYYNKKEVAQMYYYSHTYQDAENNMFETMKTIDVSKLEIKNDNRSH